MCRLTGGIYKLNGGSGGRRACHHAQLISHRSPQTNRAGGFDSPFDKDFLTGSKLTPRVEEATAQAQAGNAIVELTLGPPTPVGEEINIDARMFALFD